ncbi:hypothetical protein [Zunongwangia sp. H14]|uniref:hypothetical protein n=1 Tax=Zunongwangia sp. H14 TaxID=3240792 RepID=UPI00356B4FFE
MVQLYHFLHYRHSSDRLVVVDKKNKVANYHKNTIEGLKEILISIGFKDRREITKGNILKRINETESKSFGEIYNH